MAGWFGCPSLAPVAKLVGVVGAEVSVAPDVELLRQNGGISGCGSLNATPLKETGSGWRRREKTSRASAAALLLLTCQILHLMCVFAALLALPSVCAQLLRLRFIPN